ncbi:MAG: acetoin:2,6-dichlorophenolindophenol oxidoreductase subunit beta [Pseudonocardiales bacterium]|jgi:pyruvate/2-oxoglutarate/acetoin dehydrogenase E1 component|nr:acetoin:2,6-dichlorophenolindophenol oxidoreductase subunit beta [Pseudonocardiales bacterium]
MATTLTETAHTSATDRKGRRLTYLRAIRDAQSEELSNDPNVVMLGEDVETGMFGTSGGLRDEFGPVRVRDTPISELGFCGAAVGMAMTGLRPIVDLTIATFTYVAFDAIVSQAAKSGYMFGAQAKVPVVYRAAMFYGGGDAAHHSDRPYATFMTVPGLKIIVPSSPYDAMGLLKSAVRDDDPVLCFEDKNLWGVRETLPDEEFFVPLGQAAIKREGSDVTIVAIAGAVRLALQAAEKLNGEGISAEVIDPRSLVPLDWPTIFESVAKTGRLVIADPASRTCSAASEIAATVTEELFGQLKHAPVRVTTPDVQIPFSPPLERTLYPDPTRIAEAARRTIR